MPTIPPWGSLYAVNFSGRKGPAVEARRWVSKAAIVACLASLIILGVAVTAQGAGGPTPKPGSWKGSLAAMKGDFGYGFESGTATFKVKKKGRKLIAIGTVKTRTACEVAGAETTEDGLIPSEAGPTVKLKIKAPVSEGSASDEKGSTDTFSLYYYSFQIKSSKKGTFNLHWENSHCGATINGVVRWKHG